MNSRAFFSNNQPKSYRLHPYQARQLLASLFAQAPGFIEHRYKPQGEGMQSRFYPNVGAFLNAMSRWTVRADHYFGLATRKDSSSGRKDNLPHLVCLHGDVDFGQERPHRTREEALAAIDAFPLTPSALVDTGNGFHVYWFLLKPLQAEGNLARVEAINKGIAQALKGDPVGDASRILRVPGTYNCKNPAHLKPVALVWCEPKRRYALGEFAHYEASITPRETPRTTPRPVQWGEIGGTKYGRAAIAGELAKLAQAREGSHYRNIALNKAAYVLGQLVAGGQLDRDVVELHLHQVGVNIGLTDREVQATLRSGLEAGMKLPRGNK